MKIIVEKEVKQYINEELEIEGITLPSIEEVEEVPLELCKYNCDWWLRSKGDCSYYAAYVLNDGTIIDWGMDVDHPKVVRSILRISNLKSSNLQLGNTFKFGGKIFKIISKNLAFCLTDIGMCVFRNGWRAEDANDYEQSDVKKFIDDWFEKSLRQ